jgi:hypothetical protein
MQLGHDDLHPGHFLIGVHVNRHTSPVIADLKGSILVIDNADFPSESGDGFINGIIDDLLGQMVGPTRISIHAGPAPYRIQPFQYLQRGRVILAPGDMLEQTIIFNRKPPGEKALKI